MLNWPPLKENLYYYDDAVCIYCADCRLILPQLPKVDLVLTDPPYELGFMGKEWDKQGVSFRPETWRLVLDACKPGAMMLCFGGTRTWHRIAVAIEDAGWEIRDTLMWLYGQGFPKSLDISKAIDKMKGAEREVISSYDREGRSAGIMGNKVQITRDITAPTTPEAQLWDGYGTALKPAFEPIILAMKPLNGTFAQNALKHGVAGLNIDGSRIDYQGDYRSPTRADGSLNSGGWFGTGIVKHFDNKAREIKGRFPANLILDEGAAQELDEQSGRLTSGTGAVKKQTANGHQGVVYGTENRPAVTPNIEYGDSGGASRFFYCAKASRAERNKGCEELEEKEVYRAGYGNKENDDVTARFRTNMKNDHPTIKPLALMKYLCNLLKPPTGGVLLDPFMGSGTTLVAAQSLGRKSIGIEMEEKYCKIAVERLRQKPLDLTRPAKK